MNFPKKKYQIIYADPPWRYRHCASNSRKIENKYPTMELEDIKKLKVPADDNCILFLWATAPKLNEALEVMEEWGFDYRTCAVWDKMIIGMGYWFRNQHEILLIGIKGNMKPPEQRLRLSSVFRVKRQEHSRKPAHFRSMINVMYPNLSKIELFARQGFEGWDVWGNETPEYTQRLLK